MILHTGQAASKNIGVSLHLVKKIKMHVNKISQKAIKRELMDSQNRSLSGHCLDQL